MFIRCLSVLEQMSGLLGGPIKKLNITAGSETSIIFWLNSLKKVLIEAEQ